MTNHYLFKKYCEFKYRLNKLDVKVGDLTDNQLDIAYKLLRLRYKKTKAEHKQLKAISYVRKHRSTLDLEKLKNDYSNRLAKRKANLRVDIIMNWLGRITPMRIEKKELIK